MKRNRKKIRLILLLAVLLTTVITGCGKESALQSSDSVEKAPERYAALMDVNEFRSAFKARGRMTGLPDSAEEEAGFSITVKKIDEEENVFQYNDVTGEVDLKDLNEETFISDFQKSLNRNSDSHDFRNMELIDSGTNFYEFKVSIMDRKTDEEIASETETEDIKKTEETESESKEKTDRSSSKSEKERSTKSLSEKKGTKDAGETLSAEEETQEALLQEDSKPMLFLFVKDGKKVRELIGLDMEAESGESFSDSFLEILDEIVTIQEN